MSNSLLMEIEEITDFTESDDDESVKREMDQLLDNFPSLTEHFNLHGQVGEGTFSNVYSATLRNDKLGRKFAIKHIVPTCHPDRIKFELECLKNIGGVDNVIGIYLCIRNLNNVIFVMPYQEHHSFNEYVHKIDETELVLYMKNLLIALARVHKHNVIHRDIKPSNFLYNRREKNFLLVDFGLAQKQEAEPIERFHNDQKENHKIKVASHAKVKKKSTAAAQTSFISGKLTSPTSSPTPSLCRCYGKPTVCSICTVYKPMQASRAGTPGFRPPEVLFKQAYQTTAVDIWAAGIIMLSILSNCTNFFACPNDHAAIAELVTLFGHANVKRIAAKCGRYFQCSQMNRAELDLRKVCCTLRARGDLPTRGELCTHCGELVMLCLCAGTPLNERIVDRFGGEAYDLLKRLLDLDPKTRITAEQALQHPFFNQLTV